MNQLLGQSPLALRDLPAEAQSGNVDAHDASYLDAQLRAGLPGDAVGHLQIEERMALVALEPAANGGVRQVAQERALDVELSVEDHGDVELVGTDPVAEREERGEAPDAARKSVADHAVDLRDPLDQLAVVLVNEHRDLTVREPAPERLQGRHGEQGS